MAALTPKYRKMFHKIHKFGKTLLTVKGTLSIRCANLRPREFLASEVLRPTALCGPSDAGRWLGHGLAVP